MKKFIISTQIRIYIAGFFSALCLVAIFFVVQPGAASGDNDAILRELKGIREEIAGIRQDLMPFLIMVRTTTEKAEEEERARASAQTSQQASAQALNIVSGLRNIRDAWSQLYADNRDDFINETITNITLDMLAEYMDSSEQIFETPGEYVVEQINGYWFAGHNLVIGQKSPEVMEQLKRRASNQQLLGDIKLYAESYFSDGGFDKFDLNSLYDGQDVIFIRIQRPPEYPSRSSFPTGW